MKIFMNGREIDVPENEGGNIETVDVRKAANIPENRSIILQKRSGENYIMPKSGEIRCDPYDSFVDSPRAKRGQ